MKKIQSFNNYNFTETTNGIITAFAGSPATSFLKTDNLPESTGRLICTTENGSETETSLNFSFSEAVNITSIKAIDGFFPNIDFTFTPAGGNNSAITASLLAGSSQVDLNWDNVTSFTVSSTGSVFRFDNLVLNRSSAVKNGFTFIKYLTGFIIWLCLAYLMLVQFSVYPLMIIVLMTITMIIDYRVKHNYN